MYGDLAQLLVPGFLTAKVTIGDHTYSLRSLNPGDLYLLSGVAREGNPEWKLWVVAASVWMVDGVTLLDDRVAATRYLRTFLGQSHRAVVGHLFAQALSFFKRMKTALRYLESFLYEDESRHLWYATKTAGVTLLQRSGVPGADKLGTNLAQTSWLSWNYLEDQREEQEYSWSLAKVMVSMQSGKAAQKLDSRDKQRHETEKARREEVQRKAWYLFRGVEGDLGAGNPTGLNVRPTRTNEDLVEEMRRWVSGDQDDHDKIVSDYKERIRRDYLANETAKEVALKEAEERRRASQTAAGAAHKATRLVAYTPKELAEKFPGAVRSGSKFIIEADPVSRTFDKYLRENPVPIGGPTEPPPDTTLPGGGAPRASLMERIADRKPKFYGD